MSSGNAAVIVTPDYFAVSVHDGLEASLATLFLSHERILLHMCLTIATNAAIQ